MEWREIKTEAQLQVGEQNKRKIKNGNQISSDCHFEKLKLKLSSDL